MTKFYLHMKQAGGGCDYTIACAQKLVLLKADDRSDAIQEVKKNLEYYGFLPGNDEYRLEDLELIEIREGDVFNMLTHAQAWIDKEHEDREAARLSEANYQRELAELNRKFKR